MREHSYYVYMLASRRNGTLYVGVTNNLDRRVQQHRDGVAGGFTKAYGVKTLVWFEHFERIENAIHREKLLKRWRRAWKIALIEAENPQWLDLFEDQGPTVIPGEQGETRDPGDRIETGRCEAGAGNDR